MIGSIILLLLMSTFVFKLVYDVQKHKSIQKHKSKRYLDVDDGWSPEIDSANRDDV
jgi:hypothetical protein